MSDKGNLTEEQAALAAELAKPKVPVQGYIIFFFSFIFFSGLLTSQENFLKAFDFITLTGGSDVDIRGKGDGAIYGFRYALNNWPNILFAVGFMNVVEGQGGLKAAQRILNPLLRPALGIPGYCGLSIVTTTTTSTDAGAMMAADLSEKGLISEPELVRLTCFNFVGGAVVGSILNQSLVVVPILLQMNIPILYMHLLGIASKIIACTLVRIYQKLERPKKNKDSEAAA